MIKTKLCLKERNKESKLRLCLCLLYLNTFKCHILDLFKKYCGCVSFICLVYCINQLVSAPLLREPRDLGETAWWTGMHTYCMSKCYYVEWVKRSILWSNVKQCVKLDICKIRSSHTLHFTSFEGKKSQFKLQRREEAKTMWEEDKERQRVTTYKWLHSSRNTFSHFWTL